MSEVSIGLPVYNGAAYVAKAIESVLQQDYDDFELVISDNASTDGTKDICRHYMKVDRRVRYHRNTENIGSGPNYRQVLELSQGRFFKWLPHDDLCYPQFLSRCVPVLRNSGPTVALVYPRCELIDGEGRPCGIASDRIASSHPKRYRRFATVLRGLSYCYPVEGLFRVEYLRSVDLSVPVHYWDFVLLLEISLLGEIVEVSDVLLQQRHHCANSFGALAGDNGTSVRSDPTKADRKLRRALLEWNDPKSAKRRIWLPLAEERYWEYMKVVSRVRLPVMERLLCYAMVPIICYPARVRKVSGKWKREFLRRIRRK